ncbi:MAG: ABC transporter permease [Gemmataceae bacterium]
MNKLIGITVFLVLVYAALFLVNRDAFTFDTHFAILERLGRYGILALAAGLLIITGGIDLSIGSQVVLTSAVFGLVLTKTALGFWPALGAMVLVALAIGLAHGLLVAKVGLQPFMVTLCGLFIYRSLARYICGDKTIEQLANNMQETMALTNGELFGLPRYFCVLAVLILVCTVFLHFSVFGRYFVALGSNEQAARYAGINTDFYRILAYVLAALLTVVYAFLSLTKTPSVEPSATGVNDELVAIGSAVLGGCSLRGGEGTVYGMVVGALILVMLRMMTTFWRVSSSLEGIMIGCILLAGVIVDEILRRRQRRMK